MPWILLDPIPAKDQKQVERDAAGIAHFLVDENMDPDVSAWIDSSGIWKADHARDVGLAGKDDRSVHA